MRILGAVKKETTGSDRQEEVGGVVQVVEMTGGLPQLQNADEIVGFSVTQNQCTRLWFVEQWCERQHVCAGGSLQMETEWSLDGQQCGEVEGAEMDEDGAQDKATGEAE